MRQHSGSKLPKRSTASEVRLPVLLSIHDVTPETLDRTLAILELAASHGAESVTLLVVPGAGWLPDDLATLRRLEDDGHELAAHGWTHRCRRITTWQHRLHSLILSRDLAEHLSLEAEEISGLIARSRQWFLEQGLATPTLYVPPAWALGPVPRKVLQSLPFDRVELLTGVYDCRDDRFLRLPLVGFEADTRWRQFALRAVNGVNRAVARLTNRPLRIAVHPYDLDYFLARDLEHLLSRRAEFVGYDRLGRR